MTAPAPTPLPEPPEPEARPRSIRGPALRFGLFIAAILLAAALVRWTPLGGLLNKDTLLGLLSELQRAWWAPLALIGLYILLCPVGLPATPLLAAGAIVFGPLWGTLYNFVGLLSGAAGSYLLAKRLGREFVEHLAGKRFQKVEKAIARHGFWYLVGSRFFPLPFPLVNFAMALGGVRWGTFLAATALGLAPAIAVWSYFYSAMFTAAAGERGDLIRRLLIALSILGFFSLLPILVRRITRWRRYRQVMTARRGVGG